MRFSTTALLSTALLALASLHQTEACERGLAWGTNDNWAPKIAKGLISWYHHWQDGPNSRMPSHVEFVPTFWGPKYQSKWNQRKQEMKKKLPKHILAFNEPEIPGQANMGAKHAARLFMQEIQPYAAKGVKLSSPQMVWKLEWLETFMDECDKLGCTIDFMALHWYGSYKDMAALKKWVTSVHKRFGKPIWLTEYGITSASGASQQQIKNFHMEATHWMQTTGYVERAAWLGCFPINSPPDNYASNKNALFNSGGSLRDMAYWYIYSERPDKRSLTHSHRALPSAHAHRRAIRHVDEEGNEYEDDESTFESYQDETDCDDICQLRKESLARLEAKLEAEAEKTK
ncbi:glycoside hydrolase [Violaceomyces palustris]|uniref:Glycoside hydrolase n=1 Tax=Violaceomyces palustris TaxID=1673888 RepID=A0ACD0NQV2_9BASI|nr:glycoside hydrolase [Violaceomyces palustris]